jgi:hypothetical protein
MFDQYIEITPGRVISRRPSAEVEHLVRLRPKLETTKNFVGAGLLAMYASASMQRFKDKGLETPDVVKAPLKTITAVNVSYFTKGVYLPTGLVAEEVVVKKEWASGLVVGVVTKGPLTGVYLRTQDGSNVEDSMCANRIANDYPADNRAPYPPVFGSLQLCLKVTKDNANLAALLCTSFGKEMRIRYEELLIMQTGKLGRTPYVSDLFFDLYSQLGILFDQSEFHMIRSKN